jgi:hypothetical protein
MAISSIAWQSAHREELAQPPHDAGEHDLDGRIRPPEGRDNANFGAGTGRSRDARRDLTVPRLAASVFVQEMFSSMRVL